MQALNYPLPESKIDQHRTLKPKNHVPQGLFTLEVVVVMIVWFTFCWFYFHGTKIMNANHNVNHPLPHQPHYSALLTTHKVVVHARVARLLESFRAKVRERAEETTTLTLQSQPRPTTIIITLISSPVQDLHHWSIAIKTDSTINHTHDDSPSQVWANKKNHSCG